MNKMQALFVAGLTTIGLGSVSESSTAVAVSAPAVYAEDAAVRLYRWEAMVNVELTTGKQCYKTWVSGVVSASNSIEARRQADAALQQQVQSMSAFAKNAQARIHAVKLIQGHPLGKVRVKPQTKPPSKGSASGSPRGPAAPTTPW